MKPSQLFPLRFTRASLSRIALGLAALSAATPLSAANVSWDLAGAGGFLQPVNWAGDALPLPADTAIVGLAGANATIAAGDSVSVANLFAQDAGVITMTGGTLTATTLQGNASVPASGVSTAQIHISGGIVNALNFQLLSGSTGTLSGDTVLTARTDIRTRTGSSLSISDHVTVNAGKVVIADNVNPAPGGVAGASLPVSGDAVVIQNAPSTGSARNELWVGTGKDGLLTLSDNTSWTHYATSTSTDVVIGRGSSGTLTIGDNATLTVTGGNANGFAGGGAAVAPRPIQVGALTGGSGTVNLNGGTVATLGFLRNTGIAGVINANGGTVKALGDQSNFFANFGGSGGASSVNLLAGGLKFDTNGFAVTLTGPLSGTGGLTKLGANTLTLGGASGYTGRTTIAAGTLALSSTGSIAASTTIEIQAGATLDVSAVSGWTLASGQSLSGNGAITGHAAIDGTLAPGASPGALSFSGNLALTGAYAYEFNGAANAADLVDVGGNLTLTGTLSLTDLAAGAGLVTGDSLTLFAYDGSFTGGFAGLADGNTLHGAGHLWQIDYDSTTAGTINGGAGNRFVTLTVVPEPSALALGALGLLGLSRRRR